MAVSKEEAQGSLSEIEDTVRNTKRMLAYSGADTLFIVWGAIGVCGYLGNHFVPMWADRIWLGLLAAGVVTCIIVWKRAMPVKSRVGRRIAWFWFLLYVYVYLWFWLLWPFIRVRGPAQTAAYWRHMGAIAGTVPMFAYVTMGLWLDHFMIWIGLAITALAIAGLFLFPPYFYLWMAAAGGGTLIGTGLVIRNRWR